MSIDIGQKITTIEYLFCQFVHIISHHSQVNPAHGVNVGAHFSVAQLSLEKAGTEAAVTEQTGTYAHLYLFSRHGPEKTTST